MSPFLNPQSYGLTPLFAISYPLLLIFQILFFIYWLIRLKKTIYLSAIALIISYFNQPTLFVTKAKYKALAKDNSLSLLSYNCQQFYNNGGDKESVQNTGAKIAHFLNQEDVDIICLQEARPIIKNKLNYPYSTVIGINHFYSKYDIIKSEELIFGENTSNTSAFIDILFQRDTLRIYNLHLESIHLGSDDLLLIKNWEEANKQEQLKKTPKS